MHSILQISISRNTNFVNKVSFPKSGHICFMHIRISFSGQCFFFIGLYGQIPHLKVKLFLYPYSLFSCMNLRTSMDFCVASAKN